MFVVFVLIVLVIVWFIFRPNEVYVTPVPAYDDVTIDSTDEVDSQHNFSDQEDDHHIQQDTDDRIDVNLDNFEHIDEHVLEDEQNDHNTLEHTDEQIDDHNTLIDEDYMIDNTHLAEDNIPSVFINEDLLTSTVKSTTVNDDCEPFGFGRELIIDGIVYQEQLEIEQYRHFELYANYNNMDECVDNSGVSVEDDTPLELYIETAPNGMIINGNVYLTDQQWNTLVYVSDSTLSCAVCGAYCDEKHIQLDTHKANLELCQPLDRYDLSITRRIDSFYHCAVCNLIFHQSQSDAHFSGKEHENKLLFAINKVSDIMYDFSIHHENNNVIKNDTYHYNARTINNDSISESDEDERPRYTRYDAYGVKDSEEETDEDDENFYDNVEPPLNLACSYASMARKPKTDELPAVLEIDLGNKMVKVRFDSWNMVISPKENMFYCMVCTQYDNVRRKAKHCMSEEHVNKLALCKVIQQYEKYLVRQVDDKLYHCGHCNNLQLINEMEDHIEAQHPPTKNTSHLDSPAKKKPNVNHEVKISTETTNVTTNENEKAKKNIQEPKLVNAMNLNMYHELRAANSNLNDDIVICTFGKTVSIAKLAYNIVCGRANEYYCGLCEVSINKEGLPRHVHDLQHLILLQGTPFIEAFNIHLYRQIRDALHCALCNELIPLIPQIIIRHKMEPKHILSLGKALGQIRNVNAIEAQIKHENKFNKETKDPRNRRCLAEVTVNHAATNKSGTPIVKEDKKINTRVSTIKDGKFDSNIQDVTPTPKVQSTEFIDVKNGLKEDVDTEESDQSEELDDSMIEKEFDFEEYLYVKINNCYIKIANSSYNTLVEVGDGSKYCFVCSIVVNEDFMKHVESRGHAENMDKYRYVDKYKEDLLRQIYLMYHCSICNVIITRKHVNHHLSWPTHVLQAENCKLSSKQRKNDIKAGTKQVAVNTQKENIYLNETETTTKIILHILIQKENVVTVTRKNKIIIFNDNVLKISFDAWHSLSPLENGWKCKLCQTELQGGEFANHVTSDWHIVNLNKFEKQYSPALIRKINDTTLNCIMCNTELSLKQHIVNEHIQGKKHVKSYDSILKESSVANSYADCDEDVLTLG